MNNFIHILCLLTVAVSLSGCDMFRKLAKRPTSEELQAIRERIERDKLNADTVSESKNADTASFVDGSVAESALETQPALSHSESLPQDIEVFGPSRLGSIADGQNLPEYCIILGVFGNSGNVERLCGKISSSGYKPLKINTENGLVVVAAEPSDNLSTVFESYKKISEESFCPNGPWILSNAKQ